jgi:hypothetical protein
VCVVCVIACTEVFGTRPACAAHLGTSMPGSRAKVARVCRRRPWINQGRSVLRWMGNTRTTLNVAPGATKKEVFTDFLSLRLCPLLCVCLSPLSLYLAICFALLSVHCLSSRICMRISHAYEGTDTPTLPLLSRSIRSIFGWLAPSPSYLDMHTPPPPPRAQLGAEGNVESGTRGHVQGAVW